jgi:hypothetical protein
LKNRLKKKKLDERVIRINNSINLDKEQIWTMWNYNTLSILKRLNQNKRAFEVFWWKDDCWMLNMFQKNS